MNERLVSCLFVSVLVCSCGGESGKSKRKDATPNDPAAPATVASCVTDLATFVGDKYPTLDAMTVMKGGLLYDKWWEPLPTGSGPGEVGDLAIGAPATDHPLWETRSDPDANTRTGEATWRCKECHGWDYLGAEGAYGEGSDHFTGFGGVVEAQAKSELDVFCAIRNLENHAFGATDEASGQPILSDDEILLLTKFVKEGVVDTHLFIDPDTNTPIKVDATTGDHLPGDPVAGEAFYQTPGNCGQCHGADGASNAEDGGLGALALDDPWEVLHKIRMGSAGSNPTMRSASELGLSDEGIADVMAYLQQKLSPAGAAVAARKEAIRIGGLLFDNHWSHTGNTPPTDSGGVEIDNPVWARRDPEATSEAVGAATWRCKTCHGWDYKGVNGRYGPGSTNFTGFPDLLARQESLSARGAATVFNYLKFGVAGEHAFGDGSPAKLNDEQIGALVEFLLLPSAELPVEAQSLVGMRDTVEFIFEEQFLGRAKGDSAAGATLYAEGAAGIGRPSCADAACHKETGAGIVAVNLQALATENPWEVLHKSRFGQPGVPEMTSVWEWGIDGNAVDILTYIQSLPAIAVQ